ncbi:MAG: FmdB family zinc ribbon protein [Janthinobacterium lividum]
MPLYEYQCSQCGRRTEKRQKFADAPLTECPFCAGPLKKLISAPAIQFKGGGWFADGYGNAKTAASSSSSDGGSSAATSDAGSGSSKSEASSGSSDSAKSSAGAGGSSSASSPSAASSSSASASTPSTSK